MSNLWPTFISVPALQDTSVLTENALYPLNNAFLQIQGQDAVKFLQGQLTCDVSLVNTQHSSLGAHCSAKGRMQSSFRLFSTKENSYTLVLAADLLATAQTQLHKYAVFSKVTLSPLSDYFGMGLHGDKASAALKNLVGDLPQEDFAQTLSQDLVIICTSRQFASYEIYGTRAALEPLWQQLSEQISAYNAYQHQLLQHHLGLAFIQQTTTDAFIPQMFNYQNTPAVSFNKGCYTGQEIVARMHYLGANKRELYRAKLETNTDLKTGDSLSLEVGKQSIGYIVSLVSLGEQNWDALLVLTEAGAKADTLFHNEQAVTLTLYS